MVYTMSNLNSTDSVTTTGSSIDGSYRIAFLALLGVTIIGLITFIICLKRQDDRNMRRAQAILMQPLLVLAHDSEFANSRCRG